jgi:hypothetical protein
MIYSLRENVIAVTYLQAGAFAPWAYLQISPFLPFSPQTPFFWVLNATFWPYLSFRNLQLY